MEQNRVQVSVVRISSAAARHISPWCNSIPKRTLDFIWAALLIVLFSLPMLVVAVLVKVTSPGPTLFRQRRPGRGGREFTILKFRTMSISDGSSGPMLTRAHDPRLTWIGRHLRKWKLDELPQLFNVLRGEMSFVGPRPQPTRLWKDPSIRKLAAVVLSVRPGITSEATLKFRNEETVLAPLSTEQVEEVYLRTLMPLKLRIEKEYLAAATFMSDCRVILRTVGRVLVPQEENDDLLSRELLRYGGLRRVEPHTVQRSRAFAFEGATTLASPQKSSIRADGKASAS